VNPVEPDDGWWEALLDEEGVGEMPIDWDLSDDWGWLDQEGAF
jgi:hypothetical protein